jgi:hypothetical protein
MSKFLGSLLAAAFVARASAQAGCSGSSCAEYAGYQSSGDVSGYAAFDQDGACFEFRARGSFFLLLFFMESVLKSFFLFEQRSLLSLLTGV